MSGGAATSPQRISARLNGAARSPSQFSGVFVALEGFTAGVRYHAVMGQQPASRSWTLIRMYEQEIIDRLCSYIDLSGFHARYRFCNQASGLAMNPSHSNQRPAVKPRCLACYSFGQLRTALDITINHASAAPRSTEICPSTHSV